MASVGGGGGQEARNDSYYLSDDIHGVEGDLNQHQISMFQRYVLFVFENVGEAAWITKKETADGSCPPPSRPHRGPSQPRETTTTSTQVQPRMQDNFPAIERARAHNLTGETVPASI